MHIAFSKFYYPGFPNVQYLGHFYSTYLLMTYISGYQKQSCYQDIEAALDLFKINEMIVNPEKFQAIVIKKNCRMKDFYALNINNQTINSK